jgi:hypothetical protein
VAVTFQPNGMLAPPPKSSLARGQTMAAPAATGGAGGQSFKTMEVLETDNPMADLLELLSQAPPPPVQQQQQMPPQQMPPQQMPPQQMPPMQPQQMPPQQMPLQQMALPLTNPPPMDDIFGSLSQFGAGPPPGAPVAPLSAAPSLLDMLAPVAAPAPTFTAAPLQVMQPTVNPDAQPRTLQQIQATQDAMRPRPNPFANPPAFGAVAVPVPPQANVFPDFGRPI